MQKGEPQEILLFPSDPYIEDFVSDINRARVLKVRSVMQPIDRDSFDGEVRANDNLEHLIALSGGETGRIYLVRDGEEKVGQIDMKDLVKALVPRVKGTGEGETRAR